MWDAKACGQLPLLFNLAEMLLIPWSPLFYVTLLACAGLILKDSKFSYGGMRNPNWNPNN